MATPAPASGSKRPHSAAAAATERRVQPRHLHAGPNPSAAADPSTNAAAELHPAARLYRHALESVFAFLSQSELTSALRVSHDWLSAVQSMASLQLTVVQPAAPVCVVATSAMGRHTAAMGEPNARVKLTADSLFILAHFMSHLRGLACRLSLPPTSALLFPAALRQLEIDLRTSAAITAAHVNITLRAVGRLPLLESLIIQAKEFDPLISFAPLTALAQLRDFEFWTLNYERKLTEAQIDELRAMPHLQTLEVDVNIAAVMQRLLRLPHQLQWQHISLPNPMDDQVAALLPHLPSLTEINPVINCKRFEWLRGLPNLTEVHLWLNTISAAGRMESLVAGLQSCTNIETLSLVDCADLTVAHLADLLPRLPRLRELTLSRLSIGSLSFLALPPMTEQLSSLELSICRDLPLAELRHVHSLRGLRKLTLFCPFITRLDEHDQSLLTPPSLLLPQLVEFDYYAPDDDE